MSTLAEAARLSRYARRETAGGVLTCSECRQPIQRGEAYTWMKAVYVGERQQASVRSRPVHLGCA